MIGEIFLSTLPQPFFCSSLFSVFQGVLNDFTIGSSKLKFINLCTELADKESDNLQRYKSVIALCFVMLGISFFLLMAVTDTYKGDDGAHYLIIP